MDYWRVVKNSKIVKSEESRILIVEYHIIVIHFVYVRFGS